MNFKELQLEHTISLNPSTCDCKHGLVFDIGAQHCVGNCTYCYTKKSPPTYAISSVIDFCNILKKYSKYLKKNPIRIGFWTDPLLGLSKREIKELFDCLGECDQPFVLFTKSSALEDITLLSSVSPHLSSFHISFSTFNTNQASLLEPNVPSPLERLTAIKKLTQNGFDVVARISPFFSSEVSGAPHLILENLKANGIKKVVVALEHQNNICSNFYTAGLSDLHLFKKYANHLNISLSVCYLGHPSFLYKRWKKIWTLHITDCCQADHLQYFEPNYITRFIQKLLCWIIEKLQK